VLCHVNLLPLGALARLIRPRLPILLFVHGIEVWVRPVTRPKRWYEAWSLRALTRIVAVSAYTADRMARDFGVPPKLFRLLPNAVDPIADAADATDREPLTILTVNRMAALDREKNVDQMIRAVARLAPSLPGIKYLIVGDGVLRPEFEALAAQLGVSDIVEFCGWVGEAELRAAYARASVFAMPSSKEGFGIVYLEAWQRGLPVICSKDGAAREIVADGSDGFVVDPADTAMLADRLRRLLTQPELAKAMGENGRRKVETKYLDSMFQSTLYDILDEMTPVVGCVCAVQAEPENPRLRAGPVSGPRRN
jgi:phosphatidylinositol alpha-1,6-mannosyltransferase